MNSCSVTPFFFGEIETEYQLRSAVANDTASAANKKPEPTVNALSTRSVSATASAKAPAPASFPSTPEMPAAVIGAKAQPCPARPSPWAAQRKASTNHLRRPGSATPCLRTSTRDPMPIPTRRPFDGRIDSAEDQATENVTALHATTKVEVHGCQGDSEACSTTRTDHPCRLRHTHLRR